MKMNAEFLERLRNAALAAVFLAAPAMATTISTCAIVPSGSGGPPNNCPTSSPIAIANGGGATLNYTSVNPTIPFNTPTELGIFQVNGTPANSGVTSPATFNFWVSLAGFVGGTTDIPYFTGTVTSAGAITFSANSYGAWTPSSANGYAILTNSSNGEVIEIAASTPLIDSKNGDQTVINGEVILPAASTPEPATFGFMALGGLTMVGIARRRRAAR